MVSGTAERLLVHAGPEESSPQPSERNNTLQHIFQYWDVLRCQVPQPRALFSLDQGVETWQVSDTALDHG